MKAPTQRPRARSLQVAGAAPPRSDRECIVWLLAFLQRDIAGLRSGELLALRNDVFQHLHEAQLATLTDPLPDELRALGPVPPRDPDMTSEHVIAAARELMADLQSQLRNGLDALQAGIWSPFVHQGPAPRWSLERRADGTIQRAYMGTWNTITVASAADLLVRWWRELRRCEHEPCRVWFLPTHGRQRYHHARCSADARYQRFKPKRNYKDEYAQRYDTTRARSARARKGGKLSDHGVRKRKAKRRST